MIEVIIFYSYLLVECVTGIIVFLVMLSRHNQRITEQSKKVLEQADTKLPADRRRVGRARLESEADSDVQIAIDLDTDPGDNKV